ncbi:L-type lectin-domain containing receptor kinase IX.1-like [Panicum miliaceum]|uniref:L-type lectin-domain containing receptor kinase IX.1-like n=1 Tax=Panicum miliaceum TaxID=4540 RepID=A0A3L6SX36_PANMI|nr:L-type lectin-domain containing receptor kinase IX.1-like [Panicum miliaceum]
MDPECMVTGNPSIESDVYNFGIVILEIACGRPPRIELEDVSGYSTNDELEFANPVWKQNNHCGARLVNENSNTDFAILPLL